jgi:hypothetical protein
LLAQPETVPLKIPHVKRAPRLEDFLSGRPREAEMVVTNFRQMDPSDGAPVSQPTTAYLSFDDKNLYVGWICKDDPEKVRARVARRKDIGDDDRVTINVDTFHDRTHSYWFDVNPYAIQMDGRSTDGQDDDTSWEGLWHTEAKITKDGYVVLETIPFRTLRFPRGEKQIWGVMLGRFIQRNNEFSMWPFISHSKGNQFVGQFADMEMDANISPGRNLQFIPYALGSTSRYLDGSNGYRGADEHHMGLDAKMVFKDALTLDATINPDFSQVESDDPKVMVNQRYEVYYAEKRPFFLENSQLFILPETVFFSRRIIDPQYGAKLTGTLGRWNLGFLSADDKEPGEVLSAGERGYGQRATDIVARLERQFKHQSHIGLLLTSYNFAGDSNQVYTADTRWELGGNLVLKGEVDESRTHLYNGSTTLAPSGYANLSSYGRHFGFYSQYLDRSPNFNAQLGYITRTDIRQWDNYAQYRWRPKHSIFIDYGPNLDVSVDRNRAGQIQSWNASPNLYFEMPRLTYISLWHGEYYELYEGLGFREHASEVYASSSPYKWFTGYVDYNWGVGVNYYPAAGLAPFLGSTRNASTGFTLRPQPHLKIEQSYLYSELGVLHDHNPLPVLRAKAIFNDHVLRTKVNYQFTRELSARFILDYNGVLPNQKLVTLDNSKTVGVDFLMTYMLHPGTAVYLGYNSGWENYNFNALSTTVLTRSGAPTLLTGRQFYVKLSYLIRL